jgi:hypothetical protein
MSCDMTLVGGPGFEPGASRSRTVLVACPLVSCGILQGPAEFNRRSRRLLSCPLRSAWFRDSVPRLCPGAYLKLQGPVTLWAAVDSNHLPPRWPGPERCADERVSIDSDGAPRRVLSGVLTGLSTGRTALLAAELPF